ncbi:hypothetical protein FDA94_30385 [Herbidospora galbida]|uniref:Tn3 transposase DDE domain-containing protein n=1 Tax=Herbidospora galbida TaxID=2575442 RepID=A0A4U3M8A5_9ACTN|nr:hypothetical protein [Herbidospora galbida]TKK84234.1 hypothetical protein FDA94_30385 [Herbidospora galbida]
MREELLAHLREEKIEPPARDRIKRIIGSAISQAEKAQTVLIASRVPPEAVARMLALIARTSDPGAGDDGEDGDEGALFDAAELSGADVFARIREEPGNVSVKTIEKEVAKLKAVRQVGLPDDLFSDVAPRILASLRARVAAEAPSQLRRPPHDIKVTLLAAYLSCRGREITDTLVDLLIATVHRINARADTKVTGDFVAELKRVSGKETILFKMAEAALEAPESRVEDVIYPAVPGGHKTLVSLLHEFKAKGTSYRQHKQRVFKASYTNHYRTGLIQIIEALEFGSTNTVHAPMMDALALIKRYKAEQSNRIKCYALGERVPVDGVMPTELVELMYWADSQRRQRILRTVYECGVFQSLRDKLRCKEIWVVGADRWRNPDDDLPTDYEVRRFENYAKLRKPLDPSVFIDELRDELDFELSQLNDALGGRGLPWLKISDRKTGAIQLSPLDAAPEPVNLRRLKAAIRARWGVVPLMDMFAETALRTSCLSVLNPVGVRSELDPQELFERLLLVIYAYGTGTGIRAAAAIGHRGDLPGAFTGGVGVGQVVVEPEQEPVGQRQVVGQCRHSHVVAGDLHGPPHLPQPREGPDQSGGGRLPFGQFEPGRRGDLPAEHRQERVGLLVHPSPRGADRATVLVHAQLVTDLRGVQQMAREGRQAIVARGPRPGVQPRLQGPRRHQQERPRRAVVSAVAGLPDRHPVDDRVGLGRGTVADEQQALSDGPVPGVARAVAPHPGEVAPGRPGQGQAEHPHVVFVAQDRLPQGFPGGGQHPYPPHRLLHGFQPSGEGLPGAFQALCPLGGVRAGQRHEEVDDQPGIGQSG